MLPIVSTALYLRKQPCREVALASIGEHHRDGLAPHVRPLGQDAGRVGRRAGGHPGQHPLGTGQLDRKSVV